MCKLLPVSPLVWLSPGPDHCSLSYLLIKFFFNYLPVQSHSLSHVCMSAARTKCLLLVRGDMGPATGIKPRLHMSQACGVCSQREWGSQCQPQEQVRVSATTAGLVCVSKSSYWEGPVWVKQVRGSVSAAGAGLQVTSPCCCCQLLRWGQASVCIFPKPAVHV